MNPFNSINVFAPKRNKFDMSHEKKLTLDMGYLVPTFCQQVLPGDSWKVQTELMLRFLPMLAPIMHRIKVYTHYYFVPNRLVWDEWEPFITGGTDGDLTPEMPHWFTSDSAYFGKGTLSDYLGIETPPQGAIWDFKHQVLPFRAYQQIYNDYYRDPNDDSQLIDYYKGSGAINTGPGGQTNQENFHYTLRKRSWAKDYFHGALPWAQRGDQAIMPMSGTIQSQLVAKDSDGNPIGSEDITTGALGDVQAGTNTTTFESVDNDAIDGSFTINDLRASVKLQEWLEKMARGGARYVEQILTHFGEVSPDQRLQRAEFLGGGSQNVVISEVLSTTQSTAENQPLGEFAGHGISVGTQNRFQKKRFKEHGYVIGIMSIMPTPQLMNGSERHFFYQDKLDYAWPTFANLGEQSVYKGEVKMPYTNSFGEERHRQTFGYQPRYAEYKWAKSTIHGEFRDTLKYWHMARDYTNENPNIYGFFEYDGDKRIFAVQEADENNIIANVYHKASALRALPYYGTPKL